MAESAATPASTDLPNGFRRAQIASCISPRIQELILLPTEKCNFRCTYCYEDFELGKMSAVTQSAIEKFLERRIPNLEILRFSWFGGEPLVASDVVLRLARFAKALTDHHGVNFAGGLTTNAYVLDQKLFNDLLDCNQDFFQITLDGYGEFHDRLRQRADGRGTFDVIWKNLKAMHAQKRHFECSLRIHVRRDNLENLELLMREFATVFEGDRRIRLDFQHLRDMGGDGGKTIVDGISYEELGPIKKRLLAILESEYQKQRPASIKVSPARVVLPEQNRQAGESAGSRRAGESLPGDPYICYASKPNSLLIRSDGRIGKCTVALNDDRNNIGRIEADGTLALSNTKLAPWIRGLGTLSQKDAGCPISTMPRSVEMLSENGETRLRTVVPINQVPF